jgi:hypothetical protein
MSIDQRAFKVDKIEPPHPLPFVSRKALKRVKNPLPAPETCRYCGPNTPVFLGHHDEIYGRAYGEWPYLYLCENCEAYVGLHPFTDIPLGTLANAELRQARKANKAKFITLQRAKSWSRSRAYQWLADQMGIKVEECHWGWFEIGQCEQAGDICNLELERTK